METNFNFESSVCTSKEQSERLLALGLKKETADCYYWQETEPMYGNATGVWHLETLDSKDSQEHFEYLDKYFRICLADDEEHYFIPAWSLHRLIEMMPKCVMAHSSGDDSPRLHPYVPKFDYLGVTIENIDEILADFYQHTDLFDNFIDCIKWLIKEGYFNKEFLV